LHQAPIRGCKKTGRLRFSISNTTMRTTPLLSTIAFVTAVPIMAVAQTQTWEPVTAPGIYTFAVSPDYANDGRVWYAPKTQTFYGGSEVRWSTDRGDSFPFVGTLPAGVSNPQNLQALAVSPTYATDSVLYAGSVELLVGGHAWRSDNGGASWQELATPQSAVGYGTILISAGHAQDQTVWFAAAGQAQTTYRSANGGSSWAPIVTASTNRQFQDMALASDYVTSGLVYGLEDTGAARFARSSDFGQSFQDCLSYGGLPCAFVGVQIGIAAAPAGPGPQRTLFYFGEADPLIGSNDNFLRSQDNGMSWFPAGGGLAGLTIYDVVVPSDFLATQRVYAATDNGVFVSSDAGVTFAPLDALGLTGTVSRLKLAGGPDGDLFAQTELSQSVTGRLYRLRLRGTGLVSLGNALAGAGGAPELSVSTTFQAPTLFTLDLRQGASTTAGLHAIGFQQALAPFAGGLLVPTPDLLVAFATDAAGEAQLPLFWPSFLPPGFRVYAQSWLADPSGPQQLTASNAWQLTRL
tara:strand:+ start:2991 stop:4553 length:1563 start_codon:yes stop_codon:yes gene_type:complete